MDKQHISAGDFLAAIWRAARQYLSQERVINPSDWPDREFAADHLFEEPYHSQIGAWLESHIRHFTGGAASIRLSLPDGAPVQVYIRYDPTGYSGDVFDPRRPSKFSCRTTRLVPCHGVMTTETV